MSIGWLLRPRNQGRRLPGTTIRACTCISPPPPDGVCNPSPEPSVRGADWGGMVQAAGSTHAPPWVIMPLRRPGTKNRKRQKWPSRGMSRSGGGGAVTAPSWGPLSFWPICYWDGGAPFFCRGQPLHSSPVMPFKWWRWSAFPRSSDLWLECLRTRAATGCSRPPRRTGFAPGRMFIQKTDGMRKIRGAAH